jgi:predicted metal-binding membrane protein
LRPSWNINPGTAAALAVITIAAWLCFIRMSVSSAVPPVMPGMTMPSGALESFSGGFAMWEVMVIAMMTPTLALPLLARPENSARRAALFTLVFAIGYLCVWSFFAFLAAVAQRELDGSQRWVLIALLAVCGLYQWTHLKKASLDECRNRAASVGQDAAAIFGGGVRYGLCCLGCCWLLMVLIIATGMGNIAICAGMTLAMLAERFLPRARYATGAACVILAAGASAQPALF